MIINAFRNQPSRGSTVWGSQLLLQLAGWGCQGRRINLKMWKYTSKYTLFAFQSLIDSLSNTLIPSLAIKLNHKSNLKFIHSLLKVRNTKWDWFNARNYCRFVDRINSLKNQFSFTFYSLIQIASWYLTSSRKRCMDLVSFETQQEYDWVKGFIDEGVKFFWTSGRKLLRQ